MDDDAKVIIKQQRRDIAMLQKRLARSEDENTELKRRISRMIEKHQAMLDKFQKSDPAKWDLPDMLKELFK